MLQAKLQIFSKYLSTPEVVGIKFGWVEIILVYFLHDKKNREKGGKKEGYGIQKKERQKN